MEPGKKEANGEEGGIKGRENLRVSVFSKRPQLIKKKIYFGCWRFHMQLRTKSHTCKLFNAAGLASERQKRHIQQYGPLKCCISVAIFLRNCLYE